MVVIINVKLKHFIIVNLLKIKIYVHIHVEMVLLIIVMNNVMMEIIDQVMVVQVIVNLK
jgi:hypothetical protein